ncbi:bifunctional diguanylate cyclase/phosphodiesterase [Acholeplasma equirhinis]|uniref:putative bifunctional diguanylate cyclase/phosphodiesterase n=1 Tax=Acholeplasma equirhinis TaxID=555393 RepID=UPI00197AE376|nr:bifunctional diguanylate cyclase/phosphodiesterase [Acholeplasma equirhinis]MBN3491217.1 bifunctional diguanylate cyclase/phosphodiesterase [Acholeplasma equirhinis]
MYLVLSDWILQSLVSDPVFMSLVQTWNGVVTLTLIGLTFYVIIYKQIKSHMEKSMHLSHVFSELQTKNEKLTELESNHYKLAYYDSLTGLMNKNKLDQKVEKLIHQKVPFAVLYIDIDNFGVINELKGYEWGDNALFEIAQELKKKVNSKLVARMSEDGFVIVMEKVTDYQEVLSITKAILADIKVLLRKQSEAYFYSASGGVAMYPNHGDRFQDVLRYANLALSEAKRKGKDQIVFYNEAMQALKEREVFLTNQIHHSLDKDHFYVVYQPILKFATKELICTEALIRWNHPEIGNIPPNDFIYLAELSGSIIELTDLVCESVFKQLRTWLNQGLRTMVSINISAKVLMHPEFINKINHLSDIYQVEKSLIVIEVTESVLIDNIEYSLNVLNQLKNEGYIIALDDFGSGYSSLNYLKHLPAHVIKMDKSYIANIDQSEKEKHFLKFVVELTHSLDMRIVLEGVEKTKQEEILSEFQIDYVQGYLYSKPIKAEELFEKYVRKVL